VVKDLITGYKSPKQIHTFNSELVIIQNKVFLHEGKILRPDVPITGGQKIFAK
jgi:hypothetical protein